MTLLLVEAGILLTSIVIFFLTQSQILFLEVGILCAVSAAYFLTQKKLDIYERIIGAAMLFIAMGLPLIFTSITRSVFEVSKLLILRIGLITIVTTWLTKLIVTGNKGLLFNESVSLPDQKIFTCGPFKWVQTGVEWPLFAWIISNIASTFMTPCWPITIIGAYDRWEGIFLVLNYILLLWIFAKFSQRKTFFYWMFSSLLITAAVSSIYGIFQSQGMDFMRWSVDPTARVFASINNPVHFSAYVIMLVPLAYGLILYLLASKKAAFSLKALWHDLVQALKAMIAQKKWIPLGFDIEKKKDFTIACAFIGMIIILYTGNYLSYGRATWVGFTISTSYLYYLLTNLNNKKSIATLIIDFLSFTVLLACAILIFIFKAYLLNTAIGTLIFSVTGVGLLANYWICRNIRNFILRIAIILFAVQLPFSMVGAISCLIVISCIFIYNKLSREFVQAGQLRQAMVLFLATFFIIFFIPSASTIYSVEKTNISTWVQRTFPAAEIGTSESTGKSSAGKKEGTEDVVLAQTQRFSGHLLGGSARLSMWKSGLVWVQTYPLFGTGPGTIKEMYPTFRRSDYGRLEGGQNFTPDKLHNEYINVMATNGYTGFIIYFLWLIPAFFWILITTISRNEGVPSTYLIIGLLGGCCVYWGQTLFNFGVVATKGLFYELMGLTLAIIIMNPWRDFKDTLPADRSAPADSTAPDTAV